MAVTERAGQSPERLWIGTAVAATALLAVGSLALPELVWDRFLWHYFWGPVFADANNAACAVMRTGGPELLGSRAACAAAVESGAIVAEPGYTLVSEVGYAAALLFFLLGVLYLLRALGVGQDRELFFALVPFMFFGGVLRVVEDANDAALAAGIDTILSYPANTLIISPVIYFTVFFITVVSLVAAVEADRRGYIDDWSRALFGFASAILLVTVAFLLWFVPTRLAGPLAGAGFYPQMSLLVLGSSVVIAYAVYLGADRFAPVINEGTGRIGLVVIFGHAVDGVANVLAADWVGALGIPVEYGAKHPVNRFIIETTQSLQPESISAVVGTSWPFLVVKLVAATLVVYVFDEQIFEESPRYAILLLVAILAVGLGPGTRDMVRATFGI
ncbi:DUF63 family protein [Salinirubellus salinus]|uniref:DUF63 family protein n=1 Tax=Salinirubellus salinus TaxID=1364945 RepID=A0A9E7R6B8_9EURY|nr:DUF63 family protein [Salinirubellus salinus]UWM56128.1 DUF63 family protein [Salinirubellus salinus]